MTLREIRRAGVLAVFSRRWFGRAMCVTAVLYAVQGAVACFFAWARKAIGFTTWTDFFQAKAQAMTSGLDYTVPSRAVAQNLSIATAFEIFIMLVIGGICFYGFTAFVLRMVRDDETANYFAGALGGFARPLGLAWLNFRMQFQITLWSFLFFIPGVVAWYRYRAAWYLKVENPDWSAGKCLAESGRLMKGNKMRCFALDCSFWLVYTALTICVFALLVLQFAGTASYMTPFVIFTIAVLAWIIHAGQTVFYLSISGRQECRPNEEGRQECRLNEEGRQECRPNEEGRQECRLNEEGRQECRPNEETT